MELTRWPGSNRDLSHNWSGADILRGDGGKVEIPLFFDKKGNLKRKLRQQSAVGSLRSPELLSAPLFVIHFCQYCEIVKHQKYKGILAP